MDDDRAVSQTYQKVTGAPNSLSEDYNWNSRRFCLIFPREKELKVLVHSKDQIIQFRRIHLSRTAAAIRVVLVFKFDRLRSHPACRNISGQWTP